MAKNKETQVKEGDVAVLAKQKSTLLYQFYETIKNGGENPPPCSYITVEKG